jgi:hypothetical protein
MEPFDGGYKYPKEASGTLAEAIREKTQREIDEMVGSDADARDGTDRGSDGKTLEWIKGDVLFPPKTKKAPKKKAPRRKRAKRRR